MEIGKFGTIAVNDYHPDELELLKAAEIGRPDLIKLLLRSEIAINYQDKCEGNALILATQAGNFKSVETLIKHGNNVYLNLQDKTELTALDYSIWFSFHEITNLLIDNGIELNKKDSKGNTFLILASKHGNLNAIKKLIQKGVDLNIADNSNNTALMYAIQFGYDDIVKMLSSNGANSSLQNKKNETALILAAKLGYKEIIKIILNYSNLDINNEDDADFNALMYAAYCGHYQIAEILLKFGADPNHKGKKYGRSPLMCAAYGHHPEIYNLLIKHGAKKTIKLPNPTFMSFNELLFVIQMNIKINGNLLNVYNYLLNFSDFLEKSTLDSILNKLSKEDLQYLFTILTHKRYNAASLLLLELGIDVNFKYSNGITPLMLAIKKSNEILVEKLIKLGASITAINDAGDSSLDIACEHGYIEIVEILWRYGANINHKNYDKPNLDYYVQYKERNTELPLFISIQYGHIKLTQWILDRIDNVNQIDEIGNTALMCSVGSWKDKYGQDFLLLCLAAKIDVNIANKNRETALMIAAEYNDDIEIVKSLLLAHADVDFENTDGKNALTYAIQNNRKEIFSLMIKYTSNINQRILENKTLLMYSVIYGCVEIAREIIECGGEVDYCDDFGNTALILAALLDNLEMIMLLLKNGASVNTQNKLGHTALMEAVKNQNVFIVNALLHSHAGLDLQDINGKTALDLTTHSKFKSFISNYFNLNITNDYLTELSKEIKNNKNPTLKNEIKELTTESLPNLNLKIDDLDAFLGDPDFLADSDIPPVTEGRSSAGRKLEELVIDPIPKPPIPQK